MKPRPTALTCAILIALLMFTVAASGCGDSSKSASATSPTSIDSEPGAGSSTVEQEGEEEDPALSGLETAEEKQAASEAIRHAGEANTGSSFEVTEIEVIDGWARVGLEETGVPVEEAVGFGVYLRRLDGDDWEVVTSGTDISSDEIPDAPVGICK